jgi:hypothetical protein
MKRSDFLEHVAWTGSGIAWSLSATGLLVSKPASAATSSFSFVQISDSHIGFARPENPDVLGTFARGDQRAAAAARLRRAYRRRDASLQARAVRRGKAGALVAQGAADRPGG